MRLFKEDFSRLVAHKCVVEDLNLTHYDAYRKKELFKTFSLVFENQHCYNVNYNSPVLEMVVNWRALKCIIFTQILIKAKSIAIDSVLILAWCFII